MRRSIPRGKPARSSIWSIDSSSRNWRPFLPEAPFKKVQVITDGACLGNPGPGGWAAILRYKDKRKELWGAEAHTTNNRMELTAAVRGLAALKEGCEVEVVTDSEYLKNGITSWILNWKRNGWKTKQKKPVVNQDLWMQLDEQNRRHKTTWVWTKGHASHEDNNRADELAAMAAREQRTSAGGMR
ncbi:MAG TPA: ribonuclease HI [Bryobacteraceae bacterium]|nr:ribonuclease HI [Bryobacteraceae bacterium]